MIIGKITGQIIMRDVIRFVMMIAALFACIPARADAANVVDRVARSLTLAAGTPLRIEATVSDVTVVGSDRADVSVEIIRRAPATADFLRFPVVIDETRDGVTINITQRNDGRDAALKTEIVVQAPASVVLQAVRVFEGRVRVSGLTQACGVNLQRGPIDATALAGRIHLETGIGNIDVHDPTLTPGGMLFLRVFNGQVRVHFPHTPDNARILATTFNGAITSDIPLTKRDAFGPRFGETTIGAGDPLMSIDAVKGDIAITVGK